MHVELLIISTSHNQKEMQWGASADLLSLKSHWTFCILYQQIKDQRYGEVVQILNRELQQHPKVSRTHHGLGLKCQTKININLCSLEQLSLFSASATTDFKTLPLLQTGEREALMFGHYLICMCMHFWYGCDSYEQLVQLHPEVDDYKLYYAQVNLPLCNCNV